LEAHGQSSSRHLLRKRTRSQGPSLHRHYPASTVLRPCPTPARAAARSDVGAATTARHGPPPMTQITLPACLAPTPVDRNRCSCRLLPCSSGPPQFQAGRHPHLHFRGLLRVPSNYGPLDCSTAQGGLSRKASTRSVPHWPACQLPDQPTTIWMPCFIGDLPRRGALRYPG